MMKHLILGLASLLCCSQAMASQSVNFSGFYSIPRNYDFYLPPNYHAQGRQFDALLIEHTDQSISFPVSEVLKTPSNVLPLWRNNGLVVPEMNRIGFGFGEEWFSSVYCEFKHNVATRGYRNRALIDEEKIAIQQFDDCHPSRGYYVAVLKKDRSGGLTISHYHGLKQGDLDELSSKTPDRVEVFPRRDPPVNHLPKGWTRLQYVKDRWIFGHQNRSRSCWINGQSYPVFDLALTPFLERRPISSPATDHLDRSKSYVCQVTYTGDEASGNAPGIHWLSVFDLEGCREEVKNTCTSDFSLSK